MIGKFLLEAAGEQVLMNSLGKIWGLLKGLLFDNVKEVSKEKLKEIINSKGWEDEHFFFLDLSEANIDDGKRKMIMGGIELAERHDAANDTNSARHFRIIVTIRDKVEGLTPRPGITIIERLAETCADESEVFAAIQVAGAMHDPAFSMDTLKKIAKTTMATRPTLKVGKVIMAPVNKLDRMVSKNLKDAQVEYEKRLWWKKIPFLGGLFK